jgi:hypothetical protein
LLNCFSFLFGDGDPNEGLADKRWQLIAQVIKRNNNVVTAEQLAPYTGADPKDEDAVLPVLARFNGRPEVSEKGNMVYVFESLQTVAADQNLNPPQYLQEFPWKFSNVSQEELLPVYIVAGLNCFGAWWLWGFFVKHLDWSSIPAASVSAAHNLVVLILSLVVYGTAFLAIPIIRTIFNKMRNGRIEKRNIQRFRYSQIVANPAPELKDKLRDAYLYRIRDRRLTEKDIVYTTEKDALDQDDELSEKFKELEKDGAKSTSSPAVSKDKTYNFAPNQPDGDSADEEDKGGVIDISHLNKEKLPKKNADFDATP